MMEPKECFPAKSDGVTHNAFQNQLDDDAQCEKQDSLSPLKSALTTSPAASLTNSYSFASTSSDSSVDLNWDKRDDRVVCGTTSNTEIPIVEQENSDILLNNVDNNTSETKVLHLFEDAEICIPPSSGKDDDVYSLDDEDDECGDGEWGTPKDVWSIEKEKAMENVRNGKFRTLVSQLLKTAGIFDMEKDGESWVDIVSTLAWDAALLVNRDADEANLMDPAGYVKVKCVATGSRSQSQLIKGLVFKKHAAHKRIPTRYTKPRILLIQGMLGSSGLLSFNSMIPQDKDTKSFIENLGASHPDVVFVEKSAPRDVLEAMLKMGVTLFADMKLHRLERISRFTGSPIVSADVVLNQKLKQCETLYFEKYVEEHVEGAKKPSKTLMFLVGCSTNRGCTILLKGSQSEELKKIKCVIPRAIVIACHLILETSFLILLQEATFDVNSTNLPELSEEHLVESSVMSTKLNSTRDSSPVDLCVPFDIPISDGSEPIDNNSDDEKLLDSDNNFSTTEPVSPMFDSESILVLMSTRNTSSGTICQQSHFSQIKFYKHFDVPLGRFLKEKLFDQNAPCKECGELPEAHFYYFVHHNLQLTIRVKRIPRAKSLPGESEGKIWIWSRYGKCKPESTTRRVLMTRAARCLSFGKFLELSFNSNRLSNCAHSDFLYFFGLGNMVAMLRYSNAVTYCVSVPPQKLEFNNPIKKEWMNNEMKNFYARAMSLFTKIASYLRKIGTRLSNLNGSVKELSDIEKMLEVEKSEFEENIRNICIENGLKHLHLNRLRCELFLEACVWNKRLQSLLSSTVDTSESTDIEVEIECEPSDQTLTEIPISGEWIWNPFSEIRNKCFHDLHNNNELLKCLRFDPLRSPHHLRIISQIIFEEGSRMHIPFYTDGYILSDYEGEISSIIACALASMIGTDDEVFQYDGIKVKYNVVCTHANKFRNLRTRCCPSEIDYISSLARCKIWDAKGGKSKSLFAKTLDERLIIKEIKRTEFDSFVKFAPSYFHYMEQAFESGNQTCLAKILGIYQVSVRQVKHDVMVMENLSFGRKITRQYDLKGALHARLADEKSGDVLLDQNFVNDMNNSPMYVAQKAKRLLQRAVWNDTAFLDSINVMDYSLLVGVDHEGKEVVCGIIDYLRQYTWDKQLETLMKSSLVLPKNLLPTVISPKEYKKRFRKFIDTHFLTVPDSWHSNNQHRT